MRKLTLYLDTSVWSFYYANDAPEKKEITREFFDKINNYEIYTSDVVIKEIINAKEGKRNLLQTLINKYDPKNLNINNEIERMADIYVDKGIIPKNKKDDAIHIACCVYYQIDMLLSWNYKHLVNVYKKQRVIAVGYTDGGNK
jgi:predicted nucleic acid-binding protein